MGAVGRIDDGAARTARRTGTAWRAGLLVLLLAWSSAGFATRARAGEVDAAAVEKEVQTLIAATRPAFVFIEGGSGAVITPDGLMLTNHHVIETKGKQGEAKPEQKLVFDVRLGDGRSFVADMLGMDPQGDLALLKLRDASSLPYLPLGDSDALAVGELCLTIGNPLGLGRNDQTPTFTFGVVSGLHQYRGRYNDAIVIDAPINPGNSGGPLINMLGELVGINGLTQTRMGLKSNTGLGYAIPSNQIKLWIPHLKKAEGGIVYHARLNGLALAGDTEELLRYVQVRQVAEGSDAEKAGFQAGDVIVRFEGKPVFNNARFAGILSTFPAGTEVTVEVKRKDVPKKLTFVLQENRPWTPGFKLARPQKGDQYPRIGAVEPGSAVAKAGMEAGDEITAVGNTDITLRHLPLLVRQLQRVRAGTRIVFRVRRKKGQLWESKTIAFVAE